MDYQFLSRTALFQGSEPEQVKEMMKCFYARERHYRKGEIVLYMGDLVKDLGLVLSGGVTIERDDLLGNRSIFGHAGPGQIFAETYACLSQARSDVNVVAAQHSEVLLLQVQKVLTLCPTACPFHRLILQNLLEVTANKNRQLSLKLEILSRKTTREKLLAYLSYQAGMAPGGGKAAFVIPFNRQQLADYLSVDRSAMTVELGKLKKEGLIDFDRNTFRIC